MNGDATGQTKARETKLSRLSGPMTPELTRNSGYAVQNRLEANQDGTTECWPLPGKEEAAAGRVGRAETPETSRRQRQQQPRGLRPARPLCSPVLSDPRTRAEEQGRTHEGKQTR